MPGNRSPSCPNHRQDVVRSGVNANRLRVTVSSLGPPASNLTCPLTSLLAITPPRAAAISWASAPTADATRAVKGYPRASSHLASCWPSRAIEARRQGPVVDPSWHRDSDGAPLGALRASGALLPESCSVLGTSLFYWSKSFDSIGFIVS